MGIAIPNMRRREKMGKDIEILYCKRSAIEAKISKGNRMTGMGKSYYREFSGDRVGAGLFVIALKLLQLLNDMDRKPKIIYQFV